jgi:kojibiose phosphorylase
MLPNWIISETEFNPDTLHKQETLFGIGNGFIGSRGTFEEGYPNENPLTLVSGLFDDVPIYQTEMTNIANWVDLTFIIDGEPFRLDRGRLLYYNRTLNLRNGTLSRNVRWRSPGGATFDLFFERFISLDDPNSLAIHMTITSIDYKGGLEIQSRLGGNLYNASYRHWMLVEQGMLTSQSCYLHTATKSSHIDAGMAFHLSVQSRNSVLYEPKNIPWIPGVIAYTTVEPGQTIKIEKLISVFTKSETSQSTPIPFRMQVSNHLQQSIQQGYAELKEKNEIAWEHEWELCNVTIEGDNEIDLALRFNIFQLLIAAPRWSSHASIGYSGLTGLHHKGHVFWDTEAFCLPFFTLTNPQIAKNLLLYRYKTLEGARKKANENGYKGSMFAWESALTGEENTPRWMPSSKNSLELDRIWCGDIQQHISANVAYAVYFYWKWTQDHEFLKNYGAEILLDTARFWDSRVEWNESSGQFEITNVIGPDEYHLHVNNNAYTNWLVRWNLTTALWVMKWLDDNNPDQAERVRINFRLGQTDFDRWKSIAQNLVFLQDPNTKLIEQFDGFFDCEDVNLEEHEPRFQSMQNILGIQRTQQFQVIRQPDVLMLFFLMQNEFDESELRTNWNYYSPRTDINYGSAVGYAVHSTLAAQLNQKSIANDFLQKAATKDLYGFRANVNDGIHLGNAGAVWQAVVFGFAGLTHAESDYKINNRLPQHWSRLSFTIQKNEEPFHITIENPDSIPQVQQKPIKTSPVKNEINLNPSNEFILKQQRAYNTLVRNLAGMSYRCKNNQNRTMESVNEACYSITGCFPSEIIYDSKVAYGDLIHPADREYVLSDIEAALLADQPYWLVYRIITTTGEEKWVWEQGQGIKNNENSQFEGLEGVIIGLNDWRRGSQTLFNIAERLEILHTIDRNILEARIPKEVAQIALRHLQRLIPYDHACLILFKDFPSDAIAYLGNGDQISLTHDDAQFVSRNGDWFIHNRQGKLILDDPAWCKWIERILSNYCNTDIKSQIVVPMVTPGEILGMLVVCSQQLHLLNPIHVDIAYEIVSSLTINVRQNRLFQAISDSSKRSQLLSQQLVQIQENERRKIAHELHDEIGQSLTALKIGLLGIKKTPETENQIYETNLIIEDILKRVRSLSLDLRPTMLDDLGLVATLRWYLDRTAQRSNIQIHQNIESSVKRFPEHVETTCFRVTQEAITNVIRHAQAKNIWVNLNTNIDGKDGLELIIQDDGKGYDVQDAFEKAVKGSSLGLLGMRERVLLAGGEIDIHSVPRQGTVLSVRIPALPGFINEG